jgi:hypothetical protein
MAQANVTVGVKSGLFKKGLDEMRSQAQQWGGDIKSTIAGAFALGAVTSFVSGFITEMARVKDLADRLGESSDTIQRVGNAAKLSGSDLEFVVKTLNKLTGEAYKGADGFAAIGIQASDFANSGMEQKILMLAKAYEEANGSQQKMGELMALLGPKGQDMLIMLSQGYKDLSVQMREVNIASAETVDAMAAVDDNIESMFQHMKSGLSNVIDFFKSSGDWIAAFWEATGSDFNATEIHDQMMKKRKDDKNSKDLAKNRTKDVIENGEAAVKAKDETDKSAKNLAEEVMQLQRSRMNAEEKLADLKREQAKYDAESVDYSKSESERTNSKVKSVQLQREIDAAQLDIAKSKKDIEEKTASAQKSQDEELVKLLRSRMDAEQKITDLKREQAEYSAMANDSSKTEEERANAAKKAIQIQQEIESGQADIEKKKKDKAEKDAKEAETKAKDAAKAEADLAEEERAQKLEKMKPEDRIKELKKQQKELYDAAAKETDPQKKAEKKLEALKLNDAIDAAMKEGDKKGNTKPSVISSSLASVGGGGGAYVGTDPALTEARRQTSLLQQIARSLVGAGGSSFSTPRSPF